LRLLLGSSGLGQRCISHLLEFKLCEVADFVILLLFVAVVITLHAFAGSQVEEELYVQCTEFSRNGYAGCSNSG